MNTQDNGGPAFPGERLTYNTMGHPTGERAPVPGMSMRDYFAAKAVAGFMYMAAHGMHTKATDHAGAAAEAYRLADAMIKERAK